MEENKQQTVDKILLLEEMSEEMSKSIDNMVEVKSQQEELVEVVKQSDKAEKFKQFIEEIDEQIVTMNDQLNLIKIRYNKLISFLEKVKSNEDSKEVVLLLLDALGIFDSNR